MRKLVMVCGFFWMSLFVSYQIPAQQTSPVNEQQLESLASAGQDETEDDDDLQMLDHFRKEPVNLNTAGADELKQLFIISDEQIRQLLGYRKFFGPLISIYELQAIPGWEIAVI